MRKAAWLCIVVLMSSVAVLVLAQTKDKALLDESRVLERAASTVRTLRRSAAERITDLLWDYEFQVGAFLPIILPDQSVQTLHAGIRVFESDSGGFPDGFVTGLAGLRRNGVMVYPIEIREDSGTREWVIRNRFGIEILRLSAPEGYDPYAYARVLFDAMDPKKRSDEAWKWLCEVYDPARVPVRYDLLAATAVEDYAVREATAAVLQDMEIESGMMCAMGVGETNLGFTVIEKTAPGSSNLQITVGYPSSMSSSTICIVSCTSLINRDWSLLLSTNAPSSTNFFSYIVEDPTNIGFMACFQDGIDSDGDGIEDGDEQFLNDTKTDPDDADDPPNIKGTVSYSTYSGGQTGPVTVVAVTSSNSWVTNHVDSLSQPGAYHIINVPSNTYYLRAFMDSDNDETVDTYEAHGSHSNGAVVVTGQVVDIDIVMTDPDTDSDGMGDWWEEDYFDNLLQAETADPDIDKLSNLLEYRSGTNPTNGFSDADGDDMSDDWETGYGLDPNDAADADEDADGDGFTNLEEYESGSLGTDPTDPLSHPTGAVYVSATNGNDQTGNGHYTNAYASIGKGVTMASSGERVVALSGIYTGAANRNVSIYNKDIMVIGGSGPQETIIDCQGAGRAFRIDLFDPTNAVLRGFTMRNGSATHGGAVLADAWPEGVIRIQDCVFVSNTVSGDGGAVYARRFQTEIKDCRLQGNTAEGDGGAVYYAIGEGFIDGCALTNNTADEDGGAVYLDNTTTVTVERCVFDDNQSASYGGAIAADTDVWLSISASTFARNAAGSSARGGAISASGTELTARSSLFYENTAFLGGAVYTSDDDHATTLENCTIVDNEAGQDGGGVSCNHTNVVIRGCVVWGNTGWGGAHDQIEWFVPPLSGAVTYCDIQGWTNGGTGNINLDPRFVNDGYAVRYDSPCVDTGSNADWMTNALDIAGNPRVANETVDIGSHELVLHYVDAANDAPAVPYSSWNDAALTIQDALDVAADWSVVIVTNGVYDEDGAYVDSGTFDRVALTNSVLVRSVNGPDVTTIKGAGPRGQNAVRCAYVGNHATLQGFLLTNGYTHLSGDTDGGGAWCAAKGEISQCTVQGCAADQGGGIYGGKVSGCRISGNEANDGGGLAGSMALRCIVSDNEADNDGGGTYGGTNRSCLVAGNSAAGGGGAYGGILENCTIVSNTATSGAGIKDATALNCIVYDNNGTNWQGGTISYCCTLPYTNGPGNITNPPLFMSEGDGDYRLPSESPCIDRGATKRWMVGSSDLNGEDRVMRHTVDMGCYELFQALDVMFVIDSSGSMPSGGFMSQTKDDACVGVDYLFTTDMVGVVEFNDDGGIVTNLALLREEDGKITVREAIQEITGGGSTRVDLGLKKAQSEFNDSGRSTADQAMVFYTDGGWPGAGDDFKEEVALRTRLHALRVFAWDPDLLSWIAQRRNGVYLSYPTSAGRMSIAQLNGVMSETQPGALIAANNYHVTVDDTLIELTFRIGRGAGSCGNLVLKTPQEAEIGPDEAATMSNVTFFAYDGSQSYIVRAPSTGAWEMTISGAGGAYEACAYGQSHINAKLHFDRLQYATEEEVPLTVLTSPLATNVQAVVTKEASGTEYVVPLYDDGSHEDGAANDGLYCGSFTNTSESDTSWRVLVDVAGQTTAGHGFRRVAEGSFYVAGDDDQLGTSGAITAGDGDFTNEVYVSWASVSGADLYDVYRNTSDSRVGASLIAVTNSSPYRDTNVVPLVRYTYWVRPFNRSYIDGEFGPSDVGYASD